MAEAEAILDEAESTLFEPYRDDTPTPLVSALPSVVVDEQLDALPAAHHPFGLAEQGVTNSPTDQTDGTPINH
jgi:hypothetical protein